MGSRCSLPSNALVGGGNDNLFCAGELNFSAPCVPSRSAAGNHRANSSSSALASICHSREGGNPLGVRRITGLQTYQLAA